MNNEKYQQLKEVIQKAVPEIMELKFGCELSLDLYPKYNDKKNAIALCRVIETHKEDIEIKRIDTHSPIIWEKLNALNDYEILGRPIRLADVALAIKKDLSPDRVSMKNVGYILCFDKWNLKDNSLDNQSKECKEFLIKLLVK